MRQASQVSRFLMVGLLAFILDGVLLSLLVYQFSVSPIFSRVISCFLALLLAFYLHARFTFEANANAKAFGRYSALQVVSASLNFIAYSFWLSYGFRYGAPIVGLIIGSVIATVCNFVGNKFYVYKDTRLDTPTIH